MNLRRRPYASHSLMQDNTLFFQSAETRSNVSERALLHASALQYRRFKYSRNILEYAVWV